MTNPLCIALRELSDDWNETCGSPMMASKVCREAAEEIERLRGNLTLAEDGLASAMQENHRLTRDNAALQSQWDDMQQGLLEVFGEPVRDAIELLGATERLRSSHEPEKQS